MILLPNKTLQDWNLCALCQKKNTKEKLVDTQKSKLKLDVGKGYNTLAEKLLQFQDLGEVPISVPLSNLDDGSGIESTLRRNKACWHKSCFNSCSEMKFQRAKKRKLKCETGDEAETMDSVSCEQEASMDVSHVSPIKKTRLITAELLGVSDNEHEIQCKVCFFCNKSEGKMHRASTFELDNKVKSAAMKAQNWTLVGKLASGDMHAMDVDYHLTCLTSLYNSARSLESDTNNGTSDVEQKRPLEAIAFAELTMFVEESVAEGTTVFLLSDLVKLYTTRLQQLQLSLHVQGRVNSTRLKERLMAQIPDLYAHTDGKEVRLAFTKDVGQALKFMQENSSVDEAAMILAKAASLIRKDLFRTDYSFDGTFEQGCQGNERKRQGLARKSTEKNKEMSQDA